MGVYVILVIIWAIIEIEGSRVIFKTNKRPRNLNAIEAQMWKNKAILMGIFLFLIMALRKETVGIDTRQYMFHYNEYARMQPYSWIFQQTEIGYWLTIKVLSSFNVPWRVYFTLYNLFISFSISRFIYKHSKSSFWAFYLHLTYGIYSMSLSGMRQSIAMCICLFAYDLLKERKYKTFALLIAIAFSFHNSAYVAILLVLLPLLGKREFSAAKYLISAFVLVVIYVIRVPLFNLVYTFLPQRYVVSGSQMDFSRNQVNPLVVLIAVLIPIVCGFFYLQTKKNWKEYNEFYIGSVLCAAIEILSFNFNLVARSAWYYLMFTVILLCNTVNSFGDKKSAAIAKVLCLILPAIMFVMGSDSEASRYLFFWQ